jgi:hypothetical protein
MGEPRRSSTEAGRRLDPSECVICEGIEALDSGPVDVGRALVFACAVGACVDDPREHMCHGHADSYSNAIDDVVSSPAYPKENGR